MRKKCHVLFEWPPYVPLRLSLLPSLTVQCCLETPCLKGTYTNVNKKIIKIVFFILNQKSWFARLFSVSSLKNHRRSDLLTFNVLIILKILSMFWPFDVLIFVVRPPPTFFCLKSQKWVPSKTTSFLKLGPSNGFILKWFCHWLSF